jgi:hypothetical protein
MTAGNGSSWKLNLRPPSEVTRFVIGGQEIEVQALTLYAMDVIKDELLALGPDLDFITYARNVVRIIYKLLRVDHPEMELEEADLLKVCSITEMRNLAGAMNELLGISGFEGGPTQQTEEATLTDATTQTPSGTGTSTELSPDLPPTASAAGTSTG